MGLSYAKEEQLREQPIIRTSVRKSEDGKFMILKTEITQIKPTAYYAAIVAGDRSADEDDE